MHKEQQVSFEKELFSDNPNPEIMEIIEIVSAMLPGYELTTKNKFDIWEQYKNYDYRQFKQMLEENKRNIEMDAGIVSAANAQRFINNFRGYLRHLGRNPIDQQKARLFGTLKRRFSNNDRDLWREIYKKSLAMINEYVQVLIEYGKSGDEIWNILNKPFYDMTRKAATFEQWEDNVSMMIDTLENQSRPIQFPA